METVYFGLGALTVMVVLLITVVVIGVVRLKNVLEELRQEREVRREVIGNLNRDIENVYRNISDEVSGLNRQIDSRYDQLRNLISKN
jgi:predicted  nucleic acid-binding Zn-ribbon protein